MIDTNQVKQRLMRMAREVDGLNWADRKCIGEAIAIIDRAALLEPVGEGWRTIAVNPGFDALFEALERAQSKGYMPDAMADEWEAFDYREIAASPNGGAGS